MNKDLFFDGVEFISASQAAKKIGYASDYVGQLCRDGKVPSRMIGRTWYLDFSALLDHKKINKHRKRKPLIAKQNTGGTAFVAVPAEKIIDKKTIPVTPEKVSFRPSTASISRPAEIKNEPRLTPIYPSFASQAPAAGKRGSKHVKWIAATLLAVVVIVLGLSVALDGSANPEKLALSLFSKPKPIASNQQYGLVVAPDSSDHASLVERIKSFFSDDVKVTFDQDADTGVITPVFHEGDDTEHYAFVMVPIKQAQ